jgi:hypothetical protein
VMLNVSKFLYLCKITDVFTDCVDASLLQSYTGFYLIIVCHAVMFGYLSICACYLRFLINFNLSYYMQTYHFI